MFACDSIGEADSIHSSTASRSRVSRLPAFHRAISATAASYRSFPARSFATSAVSSFSSARRPSSRAPFWKASMVPSYFFR